MMKQKKRKNKTNLQNNLHNQRTAMTFCVRTDNARVTTKVMREHLEEEEKQQVDRKVQCNAKEEQRGRA